jgi:hypothetical protein
MWGSKQPSFSLLVLLMQYLPLVWIIQLFFFKSETYRNSRKSSPCFRSSLRNITCGCCYLLSAYNMPELMLRTVNILVLLTLLRTYCCFHCNLYKFNKHIKIKSFKSISIIEHLIQLSLGIHRKLAPGSPWDTKIQRCSRVLYKVVYYLHITYAHPPR